MNNWIGIAVKAQLKALPQPMKAYQADEEVQTNDRCVCDENVQNHWSEDPVNIHNQPHNLLMCFNDCFQSHLRPRFISHSSPTNSNVDKINFNDS